ncbi:MAG: T9SS type A sorting domain-containing protein [Flavobacteriales bacterium]
MRNFLLFGIVLFGHTAWAQTFNLRYDVMGFHSADVIWDVELESEGYSILYGSSENLNSNYGVGTLKVTFDGIVEYESFIQNSDCYLYGGWSNSTFQTDNGGYFLGSSAYCTNSSVYGALFDGNGDTLWTNKIDDTTIVEGFGYSGIQCLDGGYLICGSASHSDQTVKGIIYKLDSEGVVLWSHEYGDANAQWFVSIGRLSDGGFLLGGSKRAAPNDYDTWLIRIDQNGEELWSKTYQDISGETDGSANLVNNLDNSYVLSTSLSSNPVSGYPAIVKVNPENGDPIWYKTYGEDHNDTGLTCIKAVDSDEGYIAAGLITLNSKYHGLLTRVNENGDSLWMRQFQWMDGNHSFFRDVTPAENGGFVAVGYVFPVDSLDLSQDAWIVKTDENGCVVPGCDVSIKELDIPTRLLIYPNPAVDIVNFHFQSQTYLNSARIEIMDVTGRTVLSDNFSATEITLMMDTSKLPSGLYFVRVVSEGEVLLTEKLEKW